MSGISNFNNQALSVQLEHVRLSEDVDSSQEEQTWKTILMKACHSRREMNQQGIKRAIDIIESILKEHPTPAAHYLLAEAYLYLLPADNQTKIVKAYRDAIELSTKFEEAYRQLGTFHYRCGHYKQALEVYFEWGNHFPKRGEIWRRIGDIFTKLEMKEQACKYLLMAVSNGRKDRIDREQFTLEDQEDMIEYSE